MMIEQDKIERLLGQTCDAHRKSMNQSNTVIVREARKRISQCPSDAEARNVVAASMLVANRTEASLAVLANHKDAMDDNAMANQLAGYAYLIQGDDKTAGIYFDRAVRLDPCHADCWAWLAKIAQNENDSEMAAQYFKRAVLFEDDHHEPTLALSEMLAKNRNLTDAIHTLRVSLMGDRRSAKLNIALGRLLSRRASVLKRRRKFRACHNVLCEALECYKTANSSQPKPKSLIAQGLIQQRLEKFADAKASFQKAVDRDKTSMHALSLLANANVDCGNIPDALQQFEQVLAVNPNLSGNHFRYSRAKSFLPGKQTRSYIASLSKQLKREDLTNQDRVHLNFAMGKVMEDLKRFDQAWAHYDHANRLKPTHSQSLSKKTPDSNKQLSNLKRLADASESYFSREFFAQHAHLGNASATPVFIIGMPRSGTTLTEQILSSHPQVAGAGELRWIDRIQHELLQRDAYPQGLDTVPVGHFKDAARKYLRQLDAHRGSEIRVTDKMPTNFMHLGLIATMFPNATIIHCRRNPMDVFVSSYCQNLRGPFSDLDQLVDYYAQYRRVIAHFENVLPERIHTVDYESMVVDPEQNSRALIEHCGLAWDDRCLEFHKNNRSVHTPSKVQVRQPMYNTSVEKWRRFEKHLVAIAERVSDLQIDLTPTGKCPC